MSFFDKNQNLIKVLKILVIFVAIYILFSYFGSYFLPFLIGYILCIILYPLFKFFNNIYKIPKPLASILCIVICIFLVGIIGVGIVGQIVKEGKEFIKDLPYYIDAVKQTFTSFNNKLQSMFSILPHNLENIIFNFSNNILNIAGDFLANGLKNTSINVIKKVPNFLMMIIISLISCHLLIDKENIERFLLRQIPKNYKDKIFIVKDGIYNAVFGYIKAQAIIMCLIASICFIGLVFIKGPYALFIAFIIGVVDALPVFGSGFILWPWALYSAITGNYGMAIGLIVIYLIILITRQFVEPKIVGKQIGIHPLITLMSIYIGLKIFGVFGFIIGPIIMIIIKALQNENILPNWR